MNPVSVTLTFVVIWWLIFFMALPIGIVRDDNSQAGNCPGAPKNPNLLKKAIYTSIISAILTFSFFYLMQAGLLDRFSPR